MNRTLMTKVTKKASATLVAWVGVAVLSSAVTLAQDTGAAGQPQNQPDQGQPTAQQGPRTDGQIEMDVVHALDASAALKNDLITAATIQGEVTLSGTVASDASKQLAESIAAHVNGVIKVHNNLQVGNPDQAAQQMQAPPDTGDMPDTDQGPAQQGMAGLPPPGPGPEQAPQGQPAPSAQPPAYPQQGGYPQYPAARPQYQSPGYSQYPPQQPQYAPQYGPQAPAYAPAGGPVTIAPGTLLQVRTSEPVDTKHAVDGQPVQFMVIQDVTVGGALAIPRGAVVHGVVTESKNVGTGKLAGSPVLGLTLTSLDLGGRNYPISTDEFRVKGPNKAGQTVGNAVGAGLIGTIIGCAVGRGAGCAIGAGAGVAAGTAASAASNGPRVWIPAEALVTFRLNEPVTVAPVSQQEASRLAQGLYPGGPTLYRRPYYGPRYYAGYGYAPYPYGYPPVYYRPYYLVGGVYYWR
jgi:hypothetical protein